VHLSSPVRRINFSDFGSRLDKGKRAIPRNELTERTKTCKMQHQQPKTHKPKTNNTAKKQVTKRKQSKETPDDPMVASGFPDKAPLEGGSGENKPAVSEIIRPEKEGFLVKQGGRVKNWKKRCVCYFVFSPSPHTPFSQACFFGQTAKDGLY
jgi:hypothetical protein